MMHQSSFNGEQEKRLIHHVHPDLHPDADPSKVYAAQAEGANLHKEIAGQDLEYGYLHTMEQAKAKASEIQRTIQQDPSLPVVSSTDGHFYVPKIQAYLQRKYGGKDVAKHNTYEVNYTDTGGQYFTTATEGYNTNYKNQVRQRIDTSVRGRYWQMIDPRSGQWIDIGYQEAAASMQEMFRQNRITMAQNTHAKEARRRAAEIILKDFRSGSPHDLKYVDLDKRMNTRVSMGMDPLAIAPSSYSRARQSYAADMAEIEYRYGRTVAPKLFENQTPFERLYETERRPENRHIDDVLPYRHPYGLSPANGYAYPTGGPLPIAYSPRGYPMGPNYQYLDNPNLPRARNGLDYQSNYRDFMRQRFGPGYASIPPHAVEAIAPVLPPTAGGGFATFTTKMVEVIRSIFPSFFPSTPVVAPTVPPVSSFEKDFFRPDLVGDSINKIQTDFQTIDAPEGAPPRSIIIRPQGKNNPALTVLFDYKTGDFTVSDQMRIGLARAGIVLRAQKDILVYRPEIALTKPGKWDITASHQQDWKKAFSSISYVEPSREYSPAPRPPTKPADKPEEEPDSEAPIDSLPTVPPSVPTPEPLPTPVTPLPDAPKPDIAPDTLHIDEFSKEKVDKLSELHVAKFRELVKEREKILDRLTPEYIRHETKNGDLHLLLAATALSQKESISREEMKSYELSIKQTVQEAMALKKDIAELHTLSIDQLKQKLQSTSFATYLTQETLPRAVDINGLTDKQLKALCEICLLEKHVREKRIKYHDSTSYFTAVDTHRDLRAGDCNTTAGYYFGIASLTGSELLNQSIRSMTVPGHGQLCFNLGKNKDGKEVIFSKNSSYVNPEKWSPTGKFSDYNHAYAHNFYETSYDADFYGMKIDSMAKDSVGIVASIMGELRSEKKLVTSFTVDELKKQLLLTEKVLSLNPTDASETSNYFLYVHALFDRKEISEEQCHDLIERRLPTFIESSFYWLQSFPSILSRLPEKEAAKYYRLMEKKIENNPEAFSRYCRANIRFITELPYHDWRVNKSGETAKRNQLEAYRMLKNISFLLKKFSPPAQEICLKEGQYLLPFLEEK